MNFKEGEVLFFNKPLGWTSFKVVGHARYHICRRMKVKKLKVGHAGTLDPLATGVMIVCTGKATKRIEEFQYHTKEYIATIQLIGHNLSNSVTIRMNHTRGQPGFCYNLYRRVRAYLHTEQLFQIIQ